MLRPIVFAVALLFASAALAQNASQQKGKTIDVDSAEKHIVRAGYHNDEAVTFSGKDAGGWHLYAGAAIDADRIDLTMRNVRGTIRFRADWSRISKLLDRDKRPQ